MPKIIFVNPPLTSYQRYGVLGSVLGELQPVNLCYLASATREAAFEVEIIDAPALGLGAEKVVEQIIASSPQYVGITATTCSIFNAGLLAKAIKQRDSKIATIIGGVHVSALPEETMQTFKDFDLGVIGEGEETVVNLLQACENGIDLRETGGIISREEEELIISSPSIPVDTLDSLPMPAWDLLPDFSYYMPNLSSLHRIPAAVLITSRGCSRKCLFCDKSVFGNRVKAHSPEYVIDMIRYLYKKYHVREIAFKDSDLAFCKDRIMKICKMLRTENLKISWTCMMRPDSIDKDILVEMKKAGCWQVGIGIESGSQKILDFLKKDITLERIESCIKLLNKIGFNIMGYFMLGSPFESEDTINETIRFIKRIKIENMKLNFFTPYPGSPIYTDIGRYGNFTDDWTKLNGAYPVFVPFTLEEDNLQYFSKKMLKEFYFRPRVIMNYLSRSLSLRTFFKFFAGMITLSKYVLKRK